MHTQTHTRILSRTKVIIKNQVRASAWFKNSTLCCEPFTLQSRLHTLMGEREVLPYTMNFVLVGCKGGFNGNLKIGKMFASAPVLSFKVMLLSSVDSVDSHADGFVNPSILIGSISKLDLLSVESNSESSRVSTFLIRYCI